MGHLQLLGSRLESGDALERGFFLLLGERVGRVVHEFGQADEGAVYGRPLRIGRHRQGVGGEQRFLKAGFVAIAAGLFGIAPGGFGQGGGHGGLLGGGLVGAQALD